MFGTKHLDFIGRLYDLALNPVGWRPVLDEFCTFIDAGAASLHVMDSLNDEASMTEYGGLNTKEVLNEYNATFAAIDAEALTPLFGAVLAKDVFVSNSPMSLIG